MKIPEPKQLPSGHWFIRLRLGGESIPITTASRRECVSQAQMIKAEYLAGREVQRKKLPPAPDMTLRELLTSYIEKYRPVLSPVTIRGYCMIRDNRFAGYMDRKLREIKDWQKVINDEIGVCSAKSIKNAWSLVRAALKDAKQPVPTVKLAPLPDNELSFLQPEEIPKFLEAARGDLCEMEMLLELHGLRSSEALQVTRLNLIDLHANRIMVRGAIVRSNNGMVQKKTNKSAAGTRPVPILIPRLAELAYDYQIAGKPIPTHGTTAILRHVHQTCAAAGVTDVTNHGLRRSFASLCYSQGVNMHVLQQWGGWSDLGTLNKIYIKCAQRDKTDAERNMQAFFYEPTDEERLALAFDKLRETLGDYADLRELEPLRVELAHIQMLTGNAHDASK